MSSGARPKIEFSTRNFKQLNPPEFEKASFLFCRSFGGTGAARRARSFSKGWSRLILIWTTVAAPRFAQRSGYNRDRAFVVLRCGGTRVACEKFTTAREKKDRKLVEGEVG